MLWIVREVQRGLPFSDVPFRRETPHFTIAAEWLFAPPCTLGIGDTLILVHECESRTLEVAKSSFREENWFEQTYF